MADLKNCPVCQSVMIPNPDKTKPTHPDLVCSDPNCKFQWDKEKGDYVPSSFRTGSWLAPLPKTRKNAVSNFVQSMTPSPQDHTSMYKCNALNNATLYFSKNPIDGDIPDTSKSIIELANQLMEFFK